MAAEPVTIIGSYLSPYVRKVLAALHLKGIDYRIDPIVAFMGDDRFSRISPVRRIPVLMDDRQDGGSAAEGRMPKAADAVTLCDSSVILQYLEDRYPSPSLYPADIALRARARWLEEYADTRLGEVIIWQLFNQVAIGPHVFGRATDEAIVKRAIEEEMPQVLGYLESELPADGYACGALSIADLSICAFFRNAAFARYRIDASRFPKTAAYVERVLALECFTRVKPFEERMLRVPLKAHRAALLEMGAPLTQETYGTTSAREGMMRI
jgi:glutathione S-transferase